MAQQLRVLVVGASIAGPSTAYWLSKAGAKVTVIERFPEMRTGGQAVDIRNVGVSVMRKIPGMEESVRKNLAPIEGMSLVRDDGTPWGLIPMTGDADQQSLVSEYEIFRGDLSRIIYDLTKDDKNVEYIFGEQVSAIHHNEEKDGPVTVEFANGVLQPTQYDLVVACDGATSRTRAIGLGCGQRDYVKPMGAWSAFCSSQTDLINGSKVGLGLSAPGGRCFFLGMDPKVGNNRITMMKFCPLGSDSDNEELKQFREAQKEGKDASKAFVAKAFSGLPWIGAEAIDSLMKSDDFYASEHIHVEPPTLSKGRFVMVGDAGYGGAPGAGTSLAMAGAYILAGEISKNRGDLAAGLRGYEEQMTPIVNGMREGFGLIPYFMAPQTRTGVWIRNHIFALVSWSGLVNFVQRYFGGAFAGTNKYNMPEYEWVN